MSGGRSPMVGAIMTLVGKSVVGHYHPQPSGSSGVFGSGDGRSSVISRKRRKTAGRPACSGSEMPHSSRTGFENRSAFLAVDDLEFESLMSAGRARPVPSP